MWPFSKTKVIRDEHLQEVVDLLFPDVEVETAPDGTVFHVDRSADMNLNAALIDLQDGSNDEAVHKTIKDVINRLIRARSILESHTKLDHRAKYILVDTFSGNEKGTS